MISTLFALTLGLASWNDGPVKEAIVQFVETAINPSEKGFIPEEDRIATFDQDGTLWVEHPLYTQVFFAIDRLKELAKDHPEWKTKEPFATILKGEMQAIEKLSESDWGVILMTTHAGMDTAAFQEMVKDWLTTAKHPRFNKHYTSLAYAPMIELIEYLSENNFKVYIVSGGGQEFIRAYADLLYRLPPERIIGSSVQTKYEYRDGKPVLMRLPQMFFTDNFAGKPEGIDLFIGKKPVCAFGNSDGDEQMLQWAESSGKNRLMMLVLHDDAEREYAYGPADGLPETHVGALSQRVFDEAVKREWQVISMKRDWKTIFR